MTVDPNVLNWLWVIFLVLASVALVMHIIRQLR